MAEGNSDGDGDRYGDDGDGDGITSGGSVDSIRINAALLAVESQYMRQDRRTRNGDLPMSSRPPIRHLNRPYGLFTRRRRCGRIKIESINVSQAQKVEKTYLEHAHAAQPCGNDPKRSYRVIGPRRGCDRMKIEPVNIKIERINDKRPKEDETAYLERTQTTQPPGYHSKHCREVYRPRRRCGGIKSAPRNVSRTEGVENAYLGRVNAIRSIRRPKKSIIRLNKLTFRSRMPGERRCDDGEYG